MKRPSEVLAPHQNSVPSPILKEMHFVHSDGPSVKVHRYVIEDDHGVHYVAELSAQEAGIERCIIDAQSSEELGAMIEPAARAFALSIRLRSRYGRRARP